MSKLSYIRAFRRAGFIASMVLAVTCAQAQSYPNRPVKIVVAYAAGGGADALARTVSDALTQSLGQSFVVENKPGAGGIPAADLVAKSPADGYTLLLTDTQYVLAPAMFDKLPFDPKRDLTGVSLMTQVPLYFAVKTASSIGSLKDFIDMARANPGRYNYGTAGIGSLHHISMEAFKKELGLDITHVPYRGSGQSVVGFMGGETTVLVASLPSILPYVKEGTVKLLAVTSGQRAPQMPDVPAVSEQLPGYDFATELGILAPAGTPQPVIAKLSSAIATALTLPQVADRVSNVMGARTVGSTPDAYANSLAANLERYAVAVKASGAKSQ